MVEMTGIDVALIIIFPAILHFTLYSMMIDSIDLVRRLNHL